MGRFFDKNFEKLGAERCYDYGEGDDDKALEDDFKNWKKDLWSSIATHYMSKEGFSRKLSREESTRRDSMKRDSLRRKNT